jgi:minor extracellular serine protease Vpr
MNASRQRRTLVGAAMVVVGALAVPLTTSAQTASQPASRPTFQRTTFDGRSPSLNAGALDGDGSVRVMVQLSTPSIAAVRANAMEAGGDLAPGAEASARAAIDSQQAAVTNSIDTLGGDVELQIADAANVVVASVPRSQVALLGRTRGVTAVQPVRTLKRNNTASNAATGTDAAWEDYGFTGEGQVIAIIDDGIDYTHATFAGSGDPADYEANDPLVIEPDSFPTAKVIGGYDFVGDEYDANTEGSVPVPDPDPLPCGEHGTHVAGTAAGAGVNPDGTTYTGEYTAEAVAELKVGPGSAPSAELLAYKVFSCDGSTDDATILAAVNQAVADGATVINLSLGSPWGSAGSVDALALDDAVRSGVMVVASAGNEGSSPYMVGAPGSSDRALSVAAMDTSIEFIPGAAISGGPSGINANLADLSTPVTGTLHVLMDGDAISEGCDAAAFAGLAAGEIAVVVRGTCARVEKVTVGQAAGAAAVVMINNDSGPPPFEGEIADVTIPFVGIDGDDQDAVVALDGTAVTISDGEPFPNPNFGLATGFTSSGPRSGDSALKPEIIAPGESVESALFGSGSDSVRLSGTSMSSPHTAGIAALVRQAHPDWEPAQIKAAMMGTADVTGADYTPLTHGAGMVNPLAAIATLTGITTEDGLNSLSFGFAESTDEISVTRTIQVFNDNEFEVGYDLTSEFISEDLGAVVSIEPASVTVAAGEVADVEVTVTIDAIASAELASAADNVAALQSISGVVTAAPTTVDLEVLHVPFLIVPRGLSDISVYPSPDHLFVVNDGGHVGSADVYSWGIAGSEGEVAPFDLRAAGVQQFTGDALGADPSDTALVFAVALNGAWSNPAQAEVDILIDTNDDGEPDILVASVDEGLAGGGEPTGVAITVTVDVASGELLADPFITSAPMNSSVMLLPTLGSLIGSTSFSYTVEVLDQLSGDSDVSSNSARWDTEAPPISNGDFVELGSGDMEYIDVFQDVTSPAYESTLGWLIVSIDDATGVAQVSTIGKDQA